MRGFFKIFWWEAFSDAADCLVAFEPCFQVFSLKKEPQVFHALASRSP
jgi:hypothetical protein